MPDWNDEGLLDGLEGNEREARAELLDQLHESGVGIDELREAVRLDRLALLPVERALGGDLDLTAEDVAEQAGLDVDVLLEHRRALGLPASRDSKAFNEDDVRAAKHLKQFLDAGLPAEDVIEVTRIMGEGMWRVADAVSTLVARSMLTPGDTERDLGQKFADAANVLGPAMGDELAYAFKLHLREIVRSEMVSQAQRLSGELPGGETVTVCFADLVGFTKLGEELPPEELGRVAGRLTRLAGDVVEPPVKLVKTIGDAAMLVSPTAEPLVRASIDLVRAAEAEAEDFPQLRSGLAHGEAIGRGGDWYGRPVNVASRVCGIARPGAVLATDGVHDEAEDAFRWSFAGRRKLKGLREPIPLFRARPLSEDGP